MYEGKSVAQGSRTNKKLAEMWRFNWPIMEVLMEGRSAIDLPKLLVEDFQDANEFLKSYGFDPLDKKDAQSIHGFIAEALIFIERKLMPKEWAEGKRPPDKILLCGDARELLLWASSVKQSDAELRVWACAVLRVVHTIAHIEGVQRKASLKEAQRQILTPFEKRIFRDEEGTLWLGEKQDCIPIERVEWKRAKARDSILLKLLHKPGNVAESIYDVLGVRIITKKRIDTMKVVRYLRDLYLVTFPNTNPARSRNNLVSLDKFRSFIDGKRKELLEGEISGEEFLDELEAHCDLYSTVSKKKNPHSSHSYQSIQLTCRQLIHYEEPHFQWQKKLRDFLEKHESNEFTEYTDKLLEYVKSWRGLAEQQEVSVFFPFEVQILDLESSRLIEGGDASHDRYKKSQMRTARQRILSDVLKLPN